MYGYKIIMDNEVVSSNRGYETKEEAIMNAESDVKYFESNSCTIELFED